MSADDASPSTSSTELEQSISITASEFECQFARPFDEASVSQGVERLRSRVAVQLGNDPFVEVRSFDWFAHCPRLAETRRPRSGRHRIAGLRWLPGFTSTVRLDGGRLSAVVTTGLLT
jgi:hypothetical protein